jgi:hypothetical protein
MPTSTSIDPTRNLGRVLGVAIASVCQRAGAPSGPADDVGNGLQGPQR